MLADDNIATPPRADATTPTITNAATSEPRAKKPKLESASSTARRSTASGRNTPAQEGYHHQDHSSQGKGQIGEWDPDSGTAPPSLEAVFAAYARIPMDTQIKRYREWRRMASIFYAYFVFHFQLIL